MHSMAMGLMSDEGMPMDSGDMQDMMIDDVEVPSSSGVDQATQGSEELVPGSKLELPIETCTHCLSHSGVPNAPISSVSMADQSNKDLGSVPLPVSKFRPSISVAHIGLPGEHAPPRTSAPRYILINVFLI